MMAQKHLHELLEEDQEPFLLKNYVEDRRSLLWRPIIPRPSTLQTKKRKPALPACFSSFHDSPDYRKSPFGDFRRPTAMSRSPKAVVLHVPARTAALLLEAAMRIQKQSSSSNTKTQIKNAGLGLFGSILKKLSGKNRSTSATKSVGEAEKVREKVLAVDNKCALEMDFACSSSRRNSAIWSESNGEKSLDLETSTSCRSEDSDEKENEGFAFHEDHFCSSPLSPFRFALQKSPSSGRRTPKPTSPTSSGPENNQENKIHPVEEEEEKDQCSPVSVLDPPFEEDDDDDRHEDGGLDGDDDDDGQDISYTIVQRAKQQLLQKLRRFEKLAELDPIELEKIMEEEREDEDEDEEEAMEEEEGDEKEENIHIMPLSSETIGDGLAGDMKRLVLDLIAEEKKEEEGGIDIDVVKRVHRRLDLWKEVESNTIDMMVDLDFRKEIYGWKRNDREQVGEAAMEIELEIFGFLLDELSEELCLT
ncbi:hypothetical protein NMG60_11008394 [Bertholletia excelsa]